MNEFSATIAASASISSSVDLRYGALVGVYVPAVWTSADITLQASRDGVNFQNVRNVSGDDFLVQAGAGNCFIPLVPLELQGAKHVRLRSGTASSPVNQAAERELILVTRLIG
jgi:hypothetical protein